MPNKIVVELMDQVTELRIAVGALKTDLEGVKKLVYAAVGAAFTGAAGIVVQLVIFMVKN